MKFISLIDNKYYDKYGLSDKDILDFRSQVEKLLRENEKELVSLESRFEMYKTPNKTLDLYRKASALYKKVLSMSTDVFTYVKNKKEIFKIRRELMDINFSKAFSIPKPW